MTEEKELFLKAQEGDRDAENILFSRYQKLVSIVSHQFSNISYKDGLISDGSLGLLNAIRSYDPDSNKAAFNTYATTCIRNKMLDGLSKNQTNVAPILDDNFYEPQQLVVNSEANSSRYTAEELIDEIKKVLNEKEWPVFLLYIQEYSYKEIAAKLDITKKNVDNLIQSSKKKAKGILSKLMQ